MSDSFISKYKDILDPDGDGMLDVAGGFHDAGDHVKFGMPQVYLHQHWHGDFMNLEMLMKLQDKMST